MSDEKSEGSAGAQEGGRERQELLSQWEKERGELRGMARPAGSKAPAAEPKSVEFDPDDDGLGPTEEPSRGRAPGPGRRG